MADSDILSPFSPSKMNASIAKMLSVKPSAVNISPLSGDAGNRRYYRVTTAAANSHIASYDSSAIQQSAFIRLQKQFSDAGVAVPKIVSHTENILLLEDFGDTTYWDRLPQEADTLYRSAVEALLTIQSSDQLHQALALYDEPLLHSEMSLFKDWYCEKYLSRPLSPAAAKVLINMQQFIAQSMVSRPTVAVHRDYHSRNLMVLDDARTPGILDFQDAVAGCALYDMVSLLRDAYIQWPIPWQQNRLRDYWRRATAGGKMGVPDSFEECWELFNIVGAQRGLKVLGIFCRLALRDSKPHFLKNLPLVYQHVQDACAALPALSPLADIIADYPPQTASRH